jgi:hypothetical protein
MLKLFALFLLLVVALISWACVRFASLKNIEPIDPQKARIFSDGFLDDFIHERREAIYAKMSKDAQSRFSREKIDWLMNQLCDQVGKIIKFEFVSDIGKVSAFSKLPSRDMTYQVTTDKGKTYPFTVILVPNESELAVQEFHFSLVTLIV